MHTLVVTKKTTHTLVGRKKYTPVGRKEDTLVALRTCAHDVAVACRAVMG